MVSVRASSVPGNRVRWPSPIGRSELESSRRLTWITALPAASPSAVSCNVTEASSANTRRNVAAGPASGSNAMIRADGTAARTASANCPTFAPTSTTVRGCKSRTSSRCSTAAAAPARSPLRNSGTGSRRSSFATCWRRIARRRVSKPDPR
jgi:hypothetical protein